MESQAQANIPQEVLAMGNLELVMEVGTNELDLALTGRSEVKGLCGLHNLLP